MDELSKKRSKCKCYYQVSECQRERERHRLDGTEHVTVASETGPACVLPLKFHSTVSLSFQPVREEHIHFFSFGAMLHCRAVF